MTFLEFVCMRKRELARFCRARFGRRWRQTVTHQLGIHPRTFERWNHGEAVPRHLGRVETWARSIGFTSPADAEIQAALRDHDRFQRLSGRGNSPHIEGNTDNVLSQAQSTGPPNRLGLFSCSISCYGHGAVWSQHAGRWRPRSLDL